jgi:BASS family bile acid:Na+ symporter
MSMASIAILILRTTLLPLALGIVVHGFNQTLAERLAKPVSQVGSVGLLGCGVTILFAAAPQILALIGNGTLISIAIFMLAGLAIGHWLGGPEAENRTVLAFSTASRHPGFALALAHANFPQQKFAMAAVLLYLLINAIVAVAYHVWTKRRSPAG